LGPSGYGYAKYLILTLMTIAQFGHLGITDATAYFQRKTKYSTNEVYYTNFLYLCGIFILFFIMIMILKSRDLFLLEYDFIIIIYSSVSIILFTLINDLMTATYISSEKIIKLNNRMLLSSITVNLFYFILWITGHLDTTNYIIIFSLNSILTYIFLTSGLGIPFRVKFDKTLLIDQFKYGIIVYFGVLFLFFSFRIDQWMIKHFLSNADLGIYAIGVTISELMLIVPTSFVNPLRARLYNIDKNNVDYKKITVKTIKFTFYAVLLVSVVVFFAAELIPSGLLYGQKYADSVILVQIMVAGVVFTVFGTLGIHYFIIQGSPFMIFFINLSVLVFNFALNLFAIPKYGLIGAAAASSVSHFIYGAIYISVFAYREKIVPYKFFIIEKQELEIMINSLKLYLNKLKSN
jgi:O-antigen/teichoic acid export membrane protein